MISIKRPAAGVGAAVLLALSLSACGGGDAPTNASVEDFCAAYNDSSVFDDIEEGDYDGLVDALKEQADKLEEVGTPEDMPDGARDAFEAEIEAAQDISADDIKDAVESGDTDFAALEDIDEEDAAALQDYISENCTTE